MITVRRAGLGVLVAGCALSGCRNGGAAKGTTAVVPTAYAIPEGPDRVIADVLNGTGVSGRARVVTRILRRQGIDVVFYGDTSARADTTLILVRRGDRARADRVREALGGGRVLLAPDSMRRVDVTVMIGASPPGAGH